MPIVYDLLFSRGLRLCPIFQPSLWFPMCFWLLFVVTKYSVDQDGQIKINRVVIIFKLSTECNSEAQWMYHDNVDTHLSLNCFFLNFVQCLIVDNIGLRSFHYPSLILNPYSNNPCALICQLLVVKCLCGFMLSGFSWLSVKSKCFVGFLPFFQIHEPKLLYDFSSSWETIEYWHTFHIK